MPTTTLVYFVIIVLLIFKYKRQNGGKSARFYEKLQQCDLRLMPTPPAMPFIGHIYLMRDYQHSPWEGFNAIREEYGDIVSLKMGIHDMILLSSVEAIKEVLLKKGNIFADRPSFPRHDIVFGGDKEHSLALCNWSNTHRSRRKFCKRGVVPNKLSARNQLLERIVSKLVFKFTVDVASKQKQGSSIPLTKEAVLFLTGDIFMEFLCNESRPHSDAAYSKFNQDCDFIFWDINQCYLLDFMPYLTSFGFGYSYLKQVKQITDYCRYYIDDNIFEPRRLKHLKVRAMMIESPQKANRVDETPDDEDFDYLDSIIEELITGDTSMSLADYKVGFADLLAGHAAVANILMKLLGHLALCPEAQNLVHEEAKRTKVSDLDHQPQLPIAEAALQEALRLASSPIVPHVARKDTSIGDYYVPKGSAVLFNCYNLNLSEDMWHNPRSFDPTRFLEVSLNDLGERSYKLNIPKHFMPFSVGLRQCLGFRMVEAITIVAVSNICGRFRIEANKEDLVKKLLEPKGTVALSPLAECFELKLFPR